MKHDNLQRSPVARLPNTHTISRDGMDKQRRTGIIIIIYIHGTCLLPRVNVWFTMDIAYKSMCKCSMRKLEEKKSISLYSIFIKRFLAYFFFLILFKFNTLRYVSNAKLVQSMKYRIYSSKITLAQIEYDFLTLVQQSQLYRTITIVYFNIVINAMPE